MSRRAAPQSTSDRADGVRPRRGRPPDPERPLRVLEAARRHFYEHGFERASLDAIAAEAGVSKMTVYSHFGSKEGLFEAVIGQRTSGVVADRAGAPVPDVLHPEQALKTVAAQFVRLARDPDTLGQFRTMYAAASTQPEACAAFYRQGAERLVGELAQYLRAAHAAGSLNVPNPRMAADLFLAMFLGEAHIRGLLKLAPAAPRDDLRLIREAVRVFMAAYGPVGPGSQA